jgi:hypothetical protein
MKTGRIQRRLTVATLAVTAVAMTALSGVATAQTDPYTGGSVPGGGTGVGSAGVGRPSLSINVLETKPGKQVLLTGCGFGANQFLRITLNPGTTANAGTPCLNSPVPVQSALGTQSIQRAAVGGGIQRIRFEPLAQVGAECTFANKVNADPPDTTSGGGIGSTRADAKGCVAVWQTIPADLKPGNYELCGVATGLETVCAVLKLSAVEGSVTSRGFARTGLDLLPWLVGALLAIAVGREFVKRSRRSKSA